MIVCKCLAISIVFCFLNEVSCWEEVSQIGRRAATPLEIEIVTVADYSVFNKWYELLDPSLPEAKKIEIAKQNLTTWLGTMVHTANIVYKRLEAHGLFISMKIVDLLIMTTEADSPWTEPTKFKVNDTYFIDPDDSLSLFNPTSLELQKTIPHDHAMLFTRYPLIHRKEINKTYSGYAFLDAECEPTSLSIVQDSENMFTAVTIAHELGHSLGCEHDGTNNTCKVGLGYCMEAFDTIYIKNKWIFSSCSVDYIKEFVNKKNRLHRNCLAKVNDNHPKPALALASQKWVGELYSVDEQCVISQGEGSFMCRGVYNHNFTEFCLKMWCYNRKDDLCYEQDGGDGTPCAAGSWCVSSNCVKDSRAPLPHDDECPFGDTEGVVHNYLTCEQIAAARPNECLRYSVKQKCCVSCKTAYTTPVPVDEQCKEALGTDSYMCRALSSYLASSYEILCENLYCFNTSSDLCSSIYAYDKTACGHKKWCLDGICVQDFNAPDVSDDCPVGDHDNDPSVSYSNMTCAEIRQHDNNWECYINYTNGQCCKTCEDVRTNVKGCEYGDKHESCKTLIASDPSNCYEGDNANICCSSCSTYFTPSHKGCEYGDKYSGCVKSKCSHYTYGTRMNCCETCKSSVVIVG